MLNHRDGRGFTLVELLVVIVIIAILAGIALPILNSVQNSSKRAKSTANMRSIGGGMLSYAADHQNCLPALCNSTWTGGFWCDSLSPYMAAKVSLTKFDTGQPFTISATLVDPLLPKNRHHPQGDYGANPDVFYGPGNYPPTTTAVSLTNPYLTGKMSTLVTVVAAETTTLSPVAGSYEFNRVQVTGAASPNAWGNARPSDRGLGYYMCLFLDGHTENIPTADFINRRASLLTLNL